MQKKIGITFLFLLSYSVGFSQLTKDVFPLSREYKNGGFYVSPQATISFGNKADGQFSIVDTTYKYEVTGRGKWGYGLELGWFHTFDNSRFIDFVEGGIAYRMFQGAAEHAGNWIVADNTVSSVNSDNTFKVQTLVATIRGVEVRQIKRHSFLTLALGANFNYLLSESYKRGANYPITDESFLNQTSLQLHFQVGVGFRVSDKLLVIPTLETPLVTAYLTTEINPAFPFFGANYHPLIIGLKFMFLREDPVNCNAPQLQAVPGQ